MAATTIPTARPTALSRLVGVAYFGIVFTGIFAEFVVRGQLVVAGDAAATAANIAGSPGLFATGIGADVVMIALDVIVGLGLYRLLAPYDRRLARVATGARLIQAGILAANMFTLAPALGLAQDAVSTGSSAIAARALQAVEAHALGYDIIEETLVTQSYFLADGELIFTDFDSTPIPMPTGDYAILSLGGEMVVRAATLARSLISPQLRKHKQNPSRLPPPTC